MKGSYSGKRWNLEVLSELKLFGQPQVYCRCSACNLPEQSEVICEVSGRTYCVIAEGPVTGLLCLTLGGS